ncbi:MAG: hypothetical protein ACREAC_32325, partial [Blastocatellia bacterium]
MFRRPTAALSTESASYAAVAAVVAPVAPVAAAVRRKATEATIKLRPGFYPIPKRFELQLNSGTRPEAVISELLRHKAEMRNLIEQIALSDNNQTPSPTSEAARKFLL